MNRHKSTGMLVIVLLIGLLVGTTVGHILGALLPSNNVANKVLVTSFKYKFPPTTVNLIIFSFTFGFTLDFNFISILGIIIAWYYYKYSY